MRWVSLRGEYPVPLPVVPYKMAPESGARSKTGASGSHFGNDNYIVRYDECTMYDSTAYDCMYQDIDQYTQTNRHTTVLLATVGLAQARPIKSLAIKLLHFCWKASSTPVHLQSSYHWSWRLGLKCLIWSGCFLESKWYGSVRPMTESVSLCFPTVRPS